jgi:hypothetical protein
MTSLSPFRVVLVTLALVVGLYACASGLAELGSLDRPVFPMDPRKFNALSLGEPPGWLQAVSPFRSDLEANLALITAIRALQSGREKAAAANSGENTLPLTRVRQSLSIAPCAPELWLALALLQAQRDPHDPVVTEALKMSYFTAPNDARLMPVRLDMATVSDALADPDVKELVRGDVRLMVTRQPDMRAAVVLAYRRGSRLGKAFLEESIQSIDPSFLSTLRG